jgi:chemotaxis protein histidine kinase CheA
MDTTFVSSGRLFRERVFGGYDHDEVHEYIRQVLDAHETALAEIERLRATEPLTKAGEDLAYLLTAFAETVATRRDDANEEIERSRQEAEAYAAEKRAEADRLVAEARDLAHSVRDELITKARHEVEETAEQWATASGSLETAAGGIATALEALGRLSDLPAAELAEPEGSLDGAGLPDAPKPVWSSGGPRSRDSSLRRKLLRPEAADRVASS